MRDNMTQKSRWLWRSLWAGLSLILILAVSLLALRFYITTNSGASFIERQINQRSFGPIKRVDISGLSGDPLQDFTLASAKLYDKDGLWLSVNALSLKWSPWSLIRKKIDIQSLDVQSAQLIRIADFNSAKPQPSKPTSPYRFALKAGSIKRFHLGEALIGQSAEFSLSTQLNTDADGFIKAELDAVRTDKVGDKLRLDFTRNQAGQMTGIFNLNGTANGPMASLIRAPSHIDVTGNGQINGTLDSGAGHIIIGFNGTPQISANAKWNTQAAELNADVKTQNWPLFNPARTALGDSFSISAALDRRASPASFNLALTSSCINAQAKGALNEKGGLPQSANIAIQSDNIGAILANLQDMDIGEGRIDGRISSAPNYQFIGDIVLKDIASPHIKADKIAGPIRLTQDAPKQYNIDSQLTLTDTHLDKNIALKLSQTTRLKLKALLNTQSAQISAIRASIQSGHNQFNLSGSANYNALTYSLSGDTALNIKETQALPPGKLQASFQARKIADTALALKASGGFKPNAADIFEPFGAQIGSGLNFDMDISPLQGGVNIRTLTLTGETVRAAISGQITDVINIDGEALLSAPLTYAPISLSGQTSASFTITGQRERPKLRFDARTDKARLNGYSLMQARLRSEISSLDAPSGPLRLTAATKDGELDISALVKFTDKEITANDMTLSWGRLMAMGHISKPRMGPIIGQIDLNLPERNTQYAKASLILSANGAVQAIDLTADAKNIAYKGWAFDQFTAEASGDLLALTGRVDVSGQQLGTLIDRQFTIKSPVMMSRDNAGAFSASLSPIAEYGPIRLGVSAPITARFKSDALLIRAPLILGEDKLLINYERLDAAETLTLNAESLSLASLPLPASLADTRGRISAELALQSHSSNKIDKRKDSRNITGGGKLTLADWRGFNTDIGSGISGQLDLNLTAPNFGWSLKARSADGFEASGQGQLPISAPDSLSSLRLNMTAPLSGQFTARGEAGAILGLVTPSDAQPSGQIQAQLNLKGTLANPNIDGEASGQNLQIESPQLGTRLSRGRFKAGFTNDSLSVDDIYAADNNDGTITGSGQFKLGEYGRPIGAVKLTANRFRAIDRKDYEGTVSGSFGLKTTQSQTTVIGDIKINQAEIKQFVKGRATVIEIDVEEINIPEASQITVQEIRPKTPILLDVKIAAPRRIFVRTNGLDVELSVNAEIKGELDAVEIYGNAAIIRGGYKLAGRSLKFETGQIDFNGELGQTKVNLTANTQTQNISASLNITGTVQTPIITLSSTPERPQDEILSALLFGRSTTDLSPLEAAQLAGTLAQFSGVGGGFDLLGGLRDALGVGQLSLTSTQDGGAQITGGRYLARNVYLQLFSGGATTQTGAIIDWEIRKNISLTTRIQADNDQSFSLKWKKNF